MRIVNALKLPELYYLFISPLTFCYLKPSTVDIDVNPGVWRVPTPRSWTGDLWGCRGVEDGRGRVSKYKDTYFESTCRSMFESGLFSRKRGKLAQNVTANGNFSIFWEQ